MTYTDKEKEAAKHIVDSENIKNLLAKIFTQRSTTITMETVQKKTNEQLGEHVRADAIAEQKILQRWGELVRLGTDTESLKEQEVAPE